MVQVVPTLLSKPDTKDLPTRIVHRVVDVPPQVPDKVPCSQRPVSGSMPKKGTGNSGRGARAQLMAMTKPAAGRRKLEFFIQIVG